MPKTRSHNCNKNSKSEEAEKKTEELMKIIKKMQDDIKKIKETKINNRDVDEDEDEDIDIQEEDNYDDDYKEWDTMLEDIKKTDKKTYTNYIKVRDELLKQEPSIVDLVNSNISIENKTKLVELFELYASMYEISQEKIDLKYHIQKLHDMYIKDEKHKKILKMKKSVSMENRIMKLPTTSINKQIIYNKYKELQELTPRDDEYSKLKSWIEWSLKLPFDKTCKITKSKNIALYINKIYKELNKELYGMHKVKEQLLLFLNAKLTNPSMKGCSLGFIGKPGCGKTSIVRALARILKLPFEQISFGSVHSPSFISGHEYTYVGSQPGEIVKCLTRMKCKNGILFFDEFDKISDKSEIISMLLHITDFEQNHEYKDNYINEIKIDLSELWFIYSMNHFPQNAALKDRLYIINVPEYTITEKIHIIINHILPKCLKQLKRKATDVKMNNEVAAYLLNNCSTSEGLRTIERYIKDILYKINFLVYNQDKDGNTKMTLSFQVKQKIKYPLQLTKELAMKLCNKKAQPKFMSIYN